MENKSNSAVKAVLEYVRGDDVDMEILQRINELVTTKAMSVKGNLDPARERIFKEALDKWSASEETPQEFKNLFRGAR